MADKFDEKAHEIAMTIEDGDWTTDAIAAALRAADRDARDDEWNAAIEAAAKQLPAKHHVYSVAIRALKLGDGR